jgi:hypothetical protein
MKFSIGTARDFYSDEKEVERLKQLGIGFVKDGDGWRRKSCGETEINTLEELLSLVGEFGDVIVYEKQHLVIYDGYLE